MGVYVLTDGKGKYIRKDILTNKYVPVSSFKEAQQWDSQIKANSVLYNSVAKAIRTNYFVKLIETEKIVVKEELNKQKELCKREIADDNIDDWIGKINTIIDILSNSNERKEILTLKLSDIDKEIVDIQHYIEFGKFNCYQGWMCFKMLQNALQQRRKYKNEISVLNLIKECKVDKTSLESLFVKISDIRNKCYRPRKFPELFNRNKVKHNETEN